MDESEYKDNAQSYEKTPEDFEPDFDLEDTQVPDHPVVVEVNRLGNASAELVAWEVVENLQDDTDGEGYDFNAERVARLIRRHYEYPDFSKLDGDGVRKMYMTTPDDLLEAIMPGMSAEMDSDGSATVDSKNGG